MRHPSPLRLTHPARTSWDIASGAGLLALAATGNATTAAILLACNILVSA